MKQTWLIYSHYHIRGPLSPENLCECSVVATPGWERAKFRFRSSLFTLVTLVDHLYGVHLQTVPPLEFTLDKGKPFSSLQAAQAHEGFGFVKCSFGTRNTTRSKPLIFKQSLPTPNEPIPKGITNHSPSSSLLYDYFSKKKKRTNVFCFRGHPQVILLVISASFLPLSKLRQLCL